MKKRHPITLPEMPLVAKTRGMAGAGIRLLLNESPSGGLSRGGLDAARRRRSHDGPHLALIPGQRESTG